MYIIVRTDMTVAQQLVQAAHAALECGLYLATKPEQPDNIVLCGVASEQELHDTAMLLDGVGIAHRLISEPDMPPGRFGDQITAIATEPINKRDRRRREFPLQRLRLWTCPQNPQNLQAGVEHIDAGAPHAPAGGAIPSPRANSTPRTVNDDADETVAEAWRRCCLSMGARVATQEDLEKI